MIGAANAPAEWVAEQIREVRKRTDRPFGVNIMLMSPHADEVARTVARERVPVVTTGAGNPELSKNLSHKLFIYLISYTDEVDIFTMTEIIKQKFVSGCKNPF